MEEESEGRRHADWGMEWGMTTVAPVYRHPEVTPRTTAENSWRPLGDRVMRCVWHQVPMPQPTEYPTGVRQTPLDS